MDLGMLLIKALVLGCIVTAVLGFVLIKFLSRTTDGAVTRLNRETEQVRAKQSELNDKIKEANEELVKRRAEADELVLKMKEDASEKAKEEREKIVTKARSDSEDIILKAQRTKEDIRAVLQQEMELKAVDFSVLVLKEILSDKGKGSFNEVLINEFLENLEEVDMEMISADVNSVEVVTSEPLSEKHKNKLMDISKKKMGRPISVNASVDKEIIAGIVLRFGTLSLDGGLKHLLEDKGVEIKEKLEKGLLEKE